MQLIIDSFDCAQDRHRRRKIEVRIGRDRDKLLAWWRHSRMGDIKLRSALNVKGRERLIIPLGVCRAAIEVAAIKS
ncbi:MAG: hypothetical protein ACYSTF_10005 [Planctomycetota bacterium]|jgi:hypothetical protein